MNFLITLCFQKSEQVSKQACLTKKTKPLLSSIWYWFFKTGTSLPSIYYKTIFQITHLRMDAYIRMLKHLTWQVCKYLGAAKHPSVLALCCTSWQGLLVWVQLWLMQTDSCTRSGETVQCCFLTRRSLSWGQYKLGRFCFSLLSVNKPRCFTGYSEILLPSLDLPITNILVTKTQIGLKELFDLRQTPHKITHAGIGMLRVCWNKANWTQISWEHAG